MISARATNSAWRVPCFSQYVTYELRQMTCVERSICAIDATSDHLAIVDEDTADWRLVREQSHFGHLDGFAHEAFMVLAVGYWSEYHLA
jgi:hypothetical protein